MNHTGTLWHRTKCYRLAANFNCNSEFLIDCICSHNRLRCICAGSFVFWLWNSQLINAGNNSVNRKLCADNTRWTNKYRFDRNGKSLRCSLCCLLAIFHTLFSGTCICDTCIYDYSLCIIRIFNDIHVPFYRCRLYDIWCKCARNNTWLFRINDCHVFSVLIFYSCFDTCRLEADWCINSAIYYLHIDSLLCSIIQAL